MAKVWSVLFSLSFLLSTQGGMGTLITDECLVLATNHNKGVNVTTALKSGFTETFHFQNLSLLACEGNTRCPVITVDQSSEVNISEATAIIIVERGLLLLRFVYNGTNPSIELTDSYILSLECTPLTLLSSDGLTSYRIICAEGSGMEVRRLILNSIDLSQSSERLLFQRNVLPSNLNHSLLSNFIVRHTTNEEQILFTYEETVYHIRPSRFEIAPLGTIPPADCEFATRIALNQSGIEIVAHCQMNIVYFGIEEREWKSTLPLSKTRDLNCPGGSPGKLFPQNSTIVYSSNNTHIMLPTEYGRNGVCIGTRGHNFFIYKRNSTVVLVDLGMEVSARLSEVDCTEVDNEVLILQERYIVVANQLDRLCQTNLFDIGGNYLSAIISQDGYYSSVGIVTGFSTVTVPTVPTSSQAPPTTVPPVPPTTQETTNSTGTVPSTPPTSRSDLYALAVLSVIPFLFIFLLICLILRHKRQKTLRLPVNLNRSNFSASTLASRPSHTEISQIAIINFQSEPRLILRIDHTEGPQDTELHTAIQLQRLTPDPLDNSTMPSNENDDLPVAQVPQPSPKFASHLPHLTADASNAPEQEIEDESQPVSMQIDYGDLEDVTTEPVQAEENLDDTDVVNQSFPAHPSASFSNRTVTQNANRIQSEEAMNITAARIQLL